MFVLSGLCGGKSRMLLFDKDEALRLREFEVYAFIFGNAFDIQLTLVISNSMGPWEKFESTVVRLKRSYENIGSVVNDKRETTRAKF